MRSSLNSCTAQAALDYHSESSRHESTLSDITFSSESTVSDVFLDEDGPLTGGRSARGQGAKGREATEPFTFLAKGGDLERQRQEVPLSIEQDLFVYDDIIISKGTARTNKHWRLAGRKPLHMEGGNIPNVSSRSSISGPSGSGQKYFSFNDFDVCVDEMDVAPSTGSAPTAIEAFQKETKRRSLDAGSSHSSTTDLDRTDDGTRRITVISTINTKRKTTSAAALEETSSKSKNPQRKVLRKFECRSILGHATRVKCIALSASEKDYASCSNEDASVILNNLNVEDEVGIFTGHLDAVINATFSPDGKFLATTSKDKTMILWDVMTTKALLTFTHARVVICCCFAPDSKYIVSGCQDRVCRLWDIKHGREWLNYSHHEGIIISVTFSPDGSHVCSASADKTLRVWSSNTSKTKFTLTGHVGIILSCSYTSDGQYIISNDECLLRVWSTTDGSCMLSLSPSDLAGTPSVRGSKLGWTLSCAGPGAFSSYILVACNNRFVYVLDRETGKEVTSTYCKAPVYCLTGGTKQTAMCGDSFGNVYLLRLE